MDNRHFVTVASMFAEVIFFFFLSFVTKFGSDLVTLIIVNYFRKKNIVFFFQIF